MTSRKRKKKRKPSSIGFEKRKTFEEAGVHMPSFIVGMVVTILVMLLIWNQFAKSESVVENVQTSESADAEQLDTEQLDTEQLNAEQLNAEQLCTYLIDLNLRSRRGLSGFKADALNRDRDEVANKLLMLTLTDKQRVLAIKSRIDALSSIYGWDFQQKLNDPNVSESLRTFAELNARDPSQEIARSARLALLKHNAFERLKQPSSPASLQPVADEITGLLQDYPDDEIVLSTSQIIVQYYVNVNLVEATFLLQEIQAGVNGNESTHFQTIMQDLSDRVKIRSLHYDTEFKDRWIIGAAGEKQMINHSIELLADSHFGVLIVQVVDRVTHWFEQEGKYDQAAKVYRQMLKSSESNKSPEAAALARKTAESGLTRGKLLNQQIDFSGFSPDGTLLDPGSFDNRVVIVVFWSPKNKKSIGGLKEVFKELTPLLNNGLRILAVSPEPTMSDQLKEEFRQSKVVLAIGDPEKSGENPIWNQCPSTILPHAMLVDQTGVVVDINVPISELKTEVSFLLSLE